ncbi:LuxR family transcriptional regulator [Leucobacter komagatae]|uniref:HTH luxR-type domain-containing protein n=1 Tax=Leucobacter komagatae TaxID=55969 RepID=A0A0D0IRK9_9MICO|nr:LuxR family transcriptional regulator [Leucobacter komagatae]KIP53607.1 hypothetical protein SD72_02900 [Leucobacter komagatae]
MLRPSQILRGREPELRRACAVLHTGRSLDLLGSRGIGTSRFLQELAHRAEEQGWRTIRLRGVAALRDTPYGSLFVSGFRFSHGSVPTLGQSIEEVLGTSQQRSVVIIDQSDWVDAASWSVIDGLRSMHGTPIVRGIAQIGRAPRRRGGGASPSSQPAVTLELAGLDFEDLRLVLSDRLGGAVDPGTTARILVKSGGIIGLALRIVDAAMENGRLSEAGGVWTVTGDLWDPSLRGVIDTLLTPLPSGLREAAETLSLAETADGDALAALIGWDNIERLEQRGLLRVATSDQQRLITVFPPLLGEYFRQQPFTVRRLRLQERIARRTGAPDRGRALLARDQSARWPTSSEHNLVHARLVQEQERNRARSAGAAWELQQDAGSAIRFARALASADAPAAQIEAVLLHAGRGSNAEDTAKLVMLRAEWRVTTSGDLTEALSELETVGAVHGPWARATAATAAVLRIRFEGVPADAERTLADDGALPAGVRDVLRRGRILLFVVTGRLGLARNEFARSLPSGEGADGVDAELEALDAVAAIGLGDAKAAERWARDGLDQARAALSADRERTHAAVLALCLLGDGRLEALERLLASVFALGGTPRFLGASTAGFMLESVAAALSFRMGHPDRAEGHLATMRQARLPEGALPMQGRAWAKATQTVHQNRSQAAADALWDAAEALWGRGARFSAIFHMLSSVEIAPCVSRNDALVARLSETDVAVARPVLAALAALELRSASEVPAIAAQLRNAGLSGLALHLYDRANSWDVDAFPDGGDPVLAGHRRAFERTLTDGPYRSVRFRTQVQLTERENDVALLLGAGRSNREIADTLVLSIRTVETHVHRILRKTGARNRADVSNVLSE